MALCAAVAFALASLESISPIARASRPGPKKGTAPAPTVPDGGRTRASLAKQPASEPWPAESIPPAIYRYAERLIRQYDRNGDGVLDAEEWQKMHGDPRLADANQDGVITVDEMAQRIVEYGRNRRIRLTVPANGPGGDSETGPGSQSSQGGASPGGKAGAAEAMPDEIEEGSIDSAELEESRRQAKFYVPPKRLPAGLPSWFLARDADGDGQLSLQEFAPNPTAADLREFRRYDLNGDGLITAQECLRAIKSMKPSAKKSPGR